MNIGIIGTGWVTDLHLKALQHIENARVVAIAGRNTLRTHQLAAPFGAKCYEDAFLMLKRETLDAVFILLPPHLHGDLERACAEHVRGVLVEKPIAQSMETAHLINGYFQQAGTIVSVGYMNRYRASVVRARGLFADNSAPAILARGWWVTPMPPPLWWRAFDQSGGQFVEQCTHLVDITRYVMGEIVEISAFATRGYMKEVPDYSVDDAMVVNARFASGALASFSTGCFPKALEPDTVGIGLSISSRQHHVVLSGWKLEGVVFSEAEAQVTIPAEDDIFFIQNRAFLRAIEKNDPSFIHSDYADGMRTLAVTLAANESARLRNGAPVKVQY